MPRLRTLIPLPALLLTAAVCLAADPNAPVNVADYKAPVRVTCVGDSITVGAGAAQGMSYPDQLGRMLGDRWQVRNFAVSGTTMLKEGDFPYWETNQFRLALDSRPDVVVIMLGTNDTKPQNWKHKDQYAADYKAMIGRFAKLPSKPRVFICLPPPVPGKGNFGINEEGVREEVPEIKKIARDEGTGLIDMHAALADHPDLLPDRVHPNSEGATLLAKAAYKALTGKEFEGSVPAKADRPDQANVIPVWPHGAPGSENWTQKEVEYENPGDHKKMVRNVTRPTLTAFLPEHSRATGTAVIVCPGGGFHFLSWDNEGTDVARWLQARGVAAFVLKYRLVDTGATPEEFRKKMEEFFRNIVTGGVRNGMPEPMRKIAALATADGRQAVQVLRQHASEWGVAPDRVGIMGFSAGGIVTTGVALDHEEASRPSFAAPIYGVIGKDFKVPADAPPLFLLCASDDILVPPTDSARLYSAWHDAGHPAELHIYAKGGHGFGMARRGLPVDHWIDRFGDWLGSQGLLKPAAEERHASAPTAAPGRTEAATPRRPRQPAPTDTLTSPEVLPDHRVTFRIHAPKASEVTVGGDWLQGPGPAKLEKDERGVWSVTVGPLVPDLYSYAFSVDGVKTVDPRNATVKQGISGLDSMFFVAGPEAEFEDNRPVPHGDVRAVWYTSATLGTQRRMHVYTPPGYDAGKDRYPVLYLLHGGGDEDSGWSTIGRAGFILDNLLAEKKAKPMLIVMPNGSLPRPANLPRFTPGTPPSPEALAAFAALQERFTNELLKDVVPYVEKNYRVRTGSDNRALAGLSMGGGQTLRAVTSHPDQFAYVGVWSAGLGPNAADFEKQNAAFLESPDKVNQEIKLFSISVGDKDFTFAGSRELSELLTRHGIKNELHVSGGGHTWINWRHYLNDFAPRLFQ